MNPTQALLQLRNKFQSSNAGQTIGNLLKQTPIGELKAAADQYDRLAAQPSSPQRDAALRQATIQLGNVASGMAMGMMGTVRYKQFPGTTLMNGSFKTPPKFPSQPQAPLPAVKRASGPFYGPEVNNGQPLALEPPPTTQSSGYTWTNLGTALRHKRESSEMLNALRRRFQ